MQEVIDRSISPTSFAANKSEVSFYPNSLLFGTTHFWCVDEINNSENPSVWPGDILNFSTIVCPGITGDLDDNCDVNTGDLKLLAEYWLSVNAQMNLEGSDIINFLDFEVLCQHWLDGYVPSNNNPPTATPTAVPNVGITPLTVNFTANAGDPDNDPITYLWDFGDTVTSTEENPVHEYTASNIYTVGLTVTDGEDEYYTTLSISVFSGLVEIRVNNNYDDAEELVSNGTMYCTSSDLELINDTEYAGGDQLVGMRFNNVTIGKNAVISNAYIQFTVDETNNANPCNLTIKGQASDNAVTFVDGVNYNISNRLTTTASVAWSPNSWLVGGQSAADQRTFDISSIIQEIVNRPGWSSGNSLAIIISGTGRRIAEASESGASVAPLLHVEFTP